MPRLLALALIPLATAAIPSSAEAAPKYDFKTPGDAAYCRMEFKRARLGSVFDGFRCITPNDGFWIRFGGINAGAGRNVRITKGYSARYKGLRQPTYVLRFGRSWSSSDAQVIVCNSRSSGLTCRYPQTGVSFWLGRYHGYRIYYGKPGYPLHVRPLFRTSYAWCGINLDTLAPENPSLSCWHPGSGLVAGVAHDDAGTGGGAYRSEQARGYRPRGFPLRRAGFTLTWRCKEVTEMFAERCGLQAGSAVFTCAVSGQVRCTNVRGRGFTLDARGGFDTF